MRGPNVDRRRSLFHLGKVKEGRGRKGGACFQQGITEEAFIERRLNRYERPARNLLAQAIKGDFALENEEGFLRRESLIQVDLLYYLQAQARRVPLCPLPPFAPL